MEALIFDIETDGLLDELTKLHVFSWCWGKGEIQSTKDPAVIKELFDKAEVIVGHAITLFDLPALKKLFGIEYKGDIIDTLPNSWYLNYTQHLHGLEYYGEKFGFPKVKIDDWNSLSYEQYVERCETDVKINQLLWLDQLDHFQELYGPHCQRIIKYLQFKIHCLHLSEQSKWKVNLDLVNTSINKLRSDIEDTVSSLEAVMPKVPVVVKKTKPKKPFKKDGTLSTLGIKWSNLLKQHGLPSSYEGEIEVVVRENDPNPGSSVQVKNWLFSLGWKPETFNFVRDDTGNRKVPQVSKDGEICNSVKKLIKKVPEIQLLEGLALKKHRLSIFEGFKKNAKNGYLTARASGFTNTLRLKHAELVNLPGVDKPWGKEIRSCLIAKEGYEHCGADLSSLEENTKKHYVKPFDPDFVEQMSKPGYDAHLDLAHLNGDVTDDEYKKLWDQRLDKDCKNPHVIGSKDFTGVRKNFKVVNYAATYGAQAATIARQTGLTIQQAQQLLDIYWERNWALIEFTKTLETKKVRGQMWVFNPVSKFWYPLKNDKDKFSTVNQSTGAFIFDKWLFYILRKRPQLNGQFHDEFINEIKKGFRDQCRKLVDDANKRVNKELNLNVFIGCDVQFGDNYAQIH